MLSNQGMPLGGMGSTGLNSGVSNSSNGSLSSTGSLTALGSSGSISGEVQPRDSSNSSSNNTTTTTTTTRGLSNLNSTVNIQMRKRGRGGSVDSVRQQSVREDSTEIDDNDNNAFDGDDADDAAARKRRRNTEAARRSRLRK
ncbi:hypothetical protein HDU82_007229, partial [Entophlyctis luteolus]